MIFGRKKKLTEWDIMKAVESDPLGDCVPLDPETGKPLQGDKLAEYLAETEQVDDKRK